MVVPQSKAVLYRLSIEVRAAVSGILPAGKWRLTLSLAMVNCWSNSTEGASAAQKRYLSGGADSSPSFSSPIERPWSVASAERHFIPTKKHGARGRTGMLKTSQRPRKDSIGLHSQDIAKFLKHSVAVQNGLVVAGNANREESSTWFRKIESPLFKREV